MVSTGFVNLDGQFNSVAVGVGNNINFVDFQNNLLVTLNQAFFHRFLPITNKLICQILEFRKNIVEFKDNFFSLGGKI